MNGNDHHDGDSVNIDESKKQSNNEIYFTTQQAADKLNVSVATIYNYIKENKIKPVYEDKWKIDRTLLFRQEDIEKVDKENKKPGLSRGEVAELLNVHPSTVTAYFNKGILPYFKEEYKGRELHFVTQKDLDEFLSLNEVNNKRDMKQFSHKKFGIHLFQRLFNKVTNETARVMDMQGDQVKIMSEKGKVLSFSDSTTEGFEVVEPIENKKYITKKGYAIFTFDKPQFINSPVFNIVELFYKEIGPQNMRLASDSSYIYLEVKPTVLNVSNINLLETEISLLKQYCKEGQITVRHNKILIESNLEPLAIHVPRELKEQITQYASDEGLTIEDFVTNILNDRIQRY